MALYDDPTAQSKFVEQLKSNFIGSGYDPGLVLRTMKEGGFLQGTNDTQGMAFASALDKALNPVIGKYNQAGNGAELGATAGSWNDLFQKTVSDVASGSTPMIDANAFNQSRIDEARKAGIQINVQNADGTVTNSDAANQSQDDYLTRLRRDNIVGEAATKAWYDERYNSPEAIANRRDTSLWLKGGVLPELINKSTPPGTAASPYNVQQVNNSNISGAPSPINPNTPTPFSIQQGVANITNKGAQIPTTPLQPGSTDMAAVKALQDFLVKEGYMTQAQVDTGYGIYGPKTTAAVRALQESLGVDNSTGVGYFGPRTISALQASNKVTANTQPREMTATGLSSSGGRAIELGASYSSTNYTPAAVSAEADATSKNIQDYINMLTGPNTEGKKLYDDIRTKLLATMPDQGGRGKAQLEAEAAAGVNDLRRRLADVNADIMRKTAEYKALTTDVENRPITMNSIIGSQRAIETKAASDLGILQALALGLTGQLKAAQDSADRAVDLKYADIKDSIDIRMQQLSLLENELDKDQAVRADAVKMYLEDQKNKLAVSVANEKDKNATLLNLLQKYPDANISLSDSLEQAAAKVKNSRIYQQETRLASSGGTGSGSVTDVKPSSQYSTKQTFSDSWSNGFPIQGQIIGGNTMTKDLIKVGVSKTDFDQIQNFLSQGYTLKQIATQTGMPQDVFTVFDQYIN